ncbi:Crp/Fnr family transcriptional regulator [Pseudoflavonifractor phocaeensis]|uniref:Crp/Fnr family transcriptional regulator n=1 Tax=Pseudoflavonifractor phocaeensis TaxID=1870988 RepID=UPI00195832FF|nr:Crp/Fnr family transcriptional regulator [Pseudoflavonifractor phocaeensis]MBM6936972.1 Crp/Fnr family transcriptional regulator [Pseudoflavonifractor phocaeensis]
MKSSANIWSPLAEGQSPLPYAPGQLIYLQDTEAEAFYYIVSGTVRCFLSAPTGEERTLTLHHAGDLIGEASFFDKQPRVSSAVAVTSCMLVRIDRPRLEDVFARHPDLAVSMLEYLAQTVRLLSAHVDSAFLQADHRLARYLLTLSPDETGVLSCTHEELGAAVGLSRVTVSRTLSRFVKAGLIRTGYRSLVILDRDGLEALSQ